MPFRRPTLNDLIARARSELGPQALRRNVEDVLARVLGGAFHGLHGHVDWYGRQAMPDRCGEGQLSRWARMLLMDPRDAGAKASGYVYLPTSEVVTLPAGTRVRDDLGHRYEVTFTTGPYSGAVLVPVQALEVGSDQNLPEGEPVYLVDDVAGVDTGTSAAEFSGGRDIETASQFKRRVLSRLARQPRGGAPGDYAALALEGGAELAWEAVERSGPGTVDVYVAKFDLDSYWGTTTPGAEELEAIREYVIERAPITVEVNVTTPGGNLVVVEAEITPDTAEVREQVENELRALFVREIDEGGTIPLSRISEAIQLAEGLTSHVLTAPVTAPSAIPGNVLYLSTVNFV